MNDASIYHIVRRDEWESGDYRPASLAAEGFIHCSTAAQVMGTANRFFKGTTGLVVLRIETARLTAPLKFESATDRNELFPHIYGALNPSAVTAVFDLPGRGLSAELSRDKTVDKSGGFSGT
jgi:uncharacterized protein (DUF952 family)